MLLNTLVFPVICGRVLLVELCPYPAFALPEQGRGLGLAADAAEDPLSFDVPTADVLGFAKLTTRKQIDPTGRKELNHPPF